MCCCNCTCCTVGLIFCLVGLLFACMSSATALVSFASYGILFTYDETVINDPDFGPYAKAILFFHILGTLLTVACIAFWGLMACSDHYKVKKTINKLNLALNIITKLTWCTAAILITVSICFFEWHKFTVHYGILLWVACVQFCGSLMFAFAVFFCTYRNHEPCTFCMDQESSDNVTGVVMTPSEQHQKPYNADGTSQNIVQSAEDVRAEEYNKSKEVNQIETSADQIEEKSVVASKNGLEVRNGGSNKQSSIET